MFRKIVTGLTDVHCHLVPYVDDGASNIQEAMDLLAEQSQRGVSTVILTPHCRTGMFETPDEEIAKQYERLCVQVKNLTGAPRLMLAREYYAPTLLKRILTGQAVSTIGRKGFVLTEFPSSSNLQQLDMAVDKILSAHYRPVIAHAERIRIIQKKPEIAKILCKRGCWIQLNASSVLGKEGVATKRLCKKLLKDKSVHLIASDAHRMEVRRPNLNKAAIYLRRKLPAEQWKKLFYDNPGTLIG